MLKEVMLEPCRDLLGSPSVHMFPLYLAHLIVFFCFFFFQREHIQLATGVWKSKKNLCLNMGHHIPLAYKALKTKDFSF